MRCVLLLPCYSYGILCYEVRTATALLQLRHAVLRGITDVLIDLAAAVLLCCMHMYDYQTSAALTDCWTAVLLCYTLTAAAVLLY